MDPRLKSIKHRIPVNGQPIYDAVLNCPRIKAEFRNAMLMDIYMRISGRNDSIKNPINAQFLETNSKSNP